MAMFLGLGGDSENAWRVQDSINLSVQAPIPIDYMRESSMTKQQYLTHWNVSKVYVLGRMKRGSRDYVLSFH